MNLEDLKTAGISLHVIATGAGAGIQQKLWETPGSSAYLSGATFPYAMEETDELLGFKPESYCGKEAAIDLASAAYMKAYRFGGKKPVGVGLTASVASEREHRGDHRCFICVITNDKVHVSRATLEKGVGAAKRAEDGTCCDILAMHLLQMALGSGHPDDSSELAMQRFLLRPYFTATGKRLVAPRGDAKFALMSGAFNPPHDGHLEMQEQMWRKFNMPVMYEITANPPHKGALSVQDLLQRAKALRGNDALFTWSKPTYLDKARAYPGHSIVMGADAFLRMLDPKWGLNIDEMINEFYNLGTHFYVGGRTVNGRYMTIENIMDEANLKTNTGWKLWHLIHKLHIKSDTSSTEIRNKVLHEQ